jgi:hypothetical protein
MWYHREPRGISYVTSHSFHSSVPGSCRVADRDCKLQFATGYWLQWRCVYSQRGGLPRPKGGGCTAPGASGAWRACAPQGESVVAVLKCNHVLLEFIEDFMPQFTCRTAHIQDGESSLSLCHTQTSKGMSCQEGSFVLKGPCVLTWFGALV